MSSEVSGERGLQGEGMVSAKVLRLGRAPCILETVRRPVWLVQSGWEREVGRNRRWRIFISEADRCLRLWGFF